MKKEKNSEIEHTFGEDEFYRNSNKIECSSHPALEYKEPSFS